MSFIEIVTYVTAINIVLVAASFLLVNFNFDIKFALIHYKCKSFTQRIIPKSFLLKFAPYRFRRNIMAACNYGKPPEFKKLVELWRKILDKIEPISTLLFIIELLISIVGLGIISIASIKFIGFGAVVIYVTALASFTIYTIKEMSF
ncbi:MAG: hypothetical protein ACRC5M_06730 [Anaeroplasmataceae bacterium]